MKTIHLVMIVISILLLPTLLQVMPPASAHGVCGGLQPRYVRLEHTTLSKQTLQTGENFTITGNMTSLTGNDLKGQLFLQTKPGPDGRLVILSIRPSSGIFDIPGNSTMPYSITVTALFPGDYFVSSGLDLIGIGPILLNNGCSNTIEPNLAVTGSPICMQGLVSVTKAEDGSPACVRLGTAYNLIKRGWAASESAYPEGNSTFALYTNSTIIPGHLPHHSGLRIPYGESSEVLNYTGFDGVHKVALMYRGNPQDYVLEPGKTGTITFKLDAQATEGSGQGYGIPLPRSLNLTNYAIFYHEVTSLEDLSKYPGVTLNGDHGDFKACSTMPGGGGSCIGGVANGKVPIEAYVVDHPGVNVLFEPPLEVLPLGTNTTSQQITITINADSDAPSGTYLVELNPFGLGEFLLTVGSQPYHDVVP